MTVLFAGRSYRASVSGDSLVWESNAGAGWVLINTYDLTDASTDTLGELGSLMTAEAPTLVFVTVQSPFVTGDASTLLSDQIVVASDVSPGSLFGVLP